MGDRNTLVRALHDVGAAAWFGGSLMGAVGLNGASGDISNPGERAKIAADGWGRWAPVAAGAIGAHAIGGLGLILANRDRVRAQEGVQANTVIKAVLTVAAMASTAYSGVLGAQLANADPGHVSSGTVPSEATPERDARVQQQLRVLQWATPVLTGALIVLGAQQGEQQKAGQVLTGKATKAAKGLLHR